MMLNLRWMSSLILSLVFVSLKLLYFKLLWESIELWLMKLQLLLVVPISVSSLVLDVLCFFLKNKSMDSSLCRIVCIIRNFLRCDSSSLNLASFSSASFSSYFDRYSFSNTIPSPFDSSNSSDLSWSHFFRDFEQIAITRNIKKIKPPIAEISSKALIDFIISSLYSQSDESTQLWRSVPQHEEKQSVWLLQGLCFDIIN